MLGIYFLGTSSGVPTKERNVSAIAVLLPEPKSWVLVDCGEATQHQILHTSLSLNDLKAICITHMHGDHCYGLPGLIASAGMAGRKTPLTVIGPAALKDMYLSIQKHSELYTPFEVIFIDTENLGEYQIGSTQISAIPLSHRVPSHGFSFTTTSIKTSLLTEKLTAIGLNPGAEWGQLQRGKSVQLASGEIVNPEDYTRTDSTTRRIIICGDNDDPSRLSQQIGLTDVLVHEATYTEQILQKIGPGPQHCSAERVANFAEDNKLPHLILTHFSPRFISKTGGNFSISDIESEARASYSGDLFMADDHSQFNLSENGILSRSPSK